jgi:TetR/AcrR family transcriptional regulator, cholesterol catabolism regulator
MKVFNSYGQFEERCPINHDSIINHLLATFFKDYKDKRWRTAHENLSNIINETFRLAANMGFAKMSMRDLHQATGISIGGLYNYFESKETLESMIIEGVRFIASFSSDRLEDDRVDQDTRLEQAVRGGIYLSEKFKPWFYFVFMELRTMSPENMNKARDIEINYLHKLAKLFNNDALAACDIAVIIQNWYLKSWKFKSASVDYFTEHTLEIAKAMRAKSLQTDNSNSEQHIYLNFSQGEPA